MKRIVTVLFLFAAAIGYTGSAYAVEPSGALSKKEVRLLIATAKTPAQHLKLASYYRYEARQLEADVKEHQDLGAAYDKNPMANPIPKGQTLGDHCRNLGKYYADAAKDATEMAAMHEEMAKAVK